MELKTTFTWVFIICIVLLGVSIIRNSLYMANAQKRLSQIQQRVTDLERQKQQLFQDQMRRNSSEYIERQIRDKLRLVKPGETLVVLPSALKDAEKEDSYAYRTAESNQPYTSPIWKEWLQLFW